MSTVATFRRIATGLDDATEGAHMGHPDFRVNGRVFASLHADHLFGMVKVTPGQQHELVQEWPDAFSPENGAWGRQGYTAVRLAAVDDDVLGHVLTLARQSTLAKARAPRKTPRRARSGHSEER